jgi:hypothetical protein
LFDLFSIVTILSAIFDLFLSCLTFVCISLVFLAVIFRLGDSLFVLSFWFVCFSCGSIDKEFGFEDLLFVIIDAILLLSPMFSLFSSTLIAAPRQWFLLLPNILSIQAWSFFTSFSGNFLCVTTLEQALPSRQLPEQW